LDEERGGEGVGVEVGEELRFGERPGVGGPAAGGDVERVQRPQLGVVTQRLVVRAEVVRVDDGVDDQGVPRTSGALSRTARASALASLRRRRASCTSPRWRRSVGTSWWSGPREPSTVVSTRR